MRKIPIVRHVKVKAAANPYDPKWEPYFEKRLQRKMAATNLVLLHPTCHRQVHSLVRLFYHRVLPRGVSSGSSHVR